MMLLWRLLRQHISVVQLAGFFLANLVGLSIILCGVQVYNDVKPILSGDDSLVSQDYVIVSKPVSKDEMFNKEANRFTQEEIDDLASQPFVKKLGKFRSSRFKINASVPMLRASTLMFFESVPDSFLDVKSERWKFVPPGRPGKSVIPIIIPRAYLNLYNFGFSQTVSGPQLSEDFLSNIPLKVDVGEGYERESYDAYIVGYSDRINTILVPDSFLSWANNYYGDSSEGRDGVFRLIVEATSSSDKALLLEYITSQGYSVENNDSAMSKLSYLLNVAMWVVVGIGAIFSLLSLCILTLSIYLLLQKNTKKLENLVLAGYSSRLVAAPYQLLTAVLNLLVVAGALCVVFVLRGYYLDKLGHLFGGYLKGTTTDTWIAGAGIACVVILFNMLIIQRKVNEISRKRS
jgi:hypothetical protein